MEAQAGTAAEGASWFRTRRFFVGGVAVVFVIAYASLWVQVPGLYGSQGIEPLAERMERIAQYVSGGRRLQLPTLFWFGVSDATLALSCATGIVCALLALVGLVPRFALFACWLLYLSFVSVGEPFLNYQWDVLLLEAGLLAAVWAPGGARPFGRSERAPSRVVRWLLWWLLFRLMVLSGAVKLLGGGAWLDGTALEFHFWTQPLPHRLSWFAHHAPAFLHQLALIATFAIELALPWLVFLPWRRRLLRGIFAGGVVLLMAAISATGNYGFFNLLAAVLCIPLLDDGAWERLLRRPPSVAVAPRAQSAFVGRARATFVAAFAVLVVLVTTGRGLERLGWIRRLPGPLRNVEEWAAPLASFNAYGLFQRMTLARPQLMIEGSLDGREWRAYRPKYEPLELDRPPAFAGLHMPRLDWQLWFSALEFEGEGRSPWIGDFVARLLEGSAPVRALLAEDPFGDAPPAFVRVRVALYRFGTPAERRAGVWWERGEFRSFLPAMQRDR